MTEDNIIDKYIKCSRCKCKYINDNEHIKYDFGYNRLDERYKTCVKCRERNTKQDKTQYKLEATNKSIIDRYNVIYPYPYRI